MFSENILSLEEEDELDDEDEDEEEEFKSSDTLSNREHYSITKVDIIIKCCDNNSVIYMSPFLLNDSP